MNRKESLKKQAQKVRRARRVRAKIHGTAERPRLSVFRSAKHIFAQLIDDDAQKTLASASDKEVDGAGKKPVEIAGLVGAVIGKKAKEKQIETVIFDRGPYLYHGRVRSLAESAREAGLKF